ncbi:AraC family transcriptional regulator of adaptative response / methylphosphotriester-DNA alkyltransferase methyltransferase [Caldalkalibacillus uzonensis]|uniref:AraC family transcriptional regulator of adaptative response / methylphosphotriester-DNA alkyltransferase methyltransferase n=1 Tax=Caldalkalibacillus uzonensis TaxID=353224 RepID=A0ABU0CWI8_9BACI|nr:Ada metal-binding domain-containing protein [Caldalkalibacillus uzonensis]MDQ0340473.1 AraC family transcriptional regulator of adaptative response / methylphosphotriester-DNA alkyltransferase methyltransferase [Caldalkalibacillus uzonensis]
MMVDIHKAALWQAVVECDRKYDGIFYYAVKTTGIFCRPSCPSKPPKRENAVFFFDRDEAVQQGYRACKRCRPDLPLSAYDPQQEVINNAKHIMQLEYHKPWTLQSLSQRLGVSPYHLQRLFKQRVGVSPKQFLKQVRIQQAKLLLIKGEHSNTEICFSVGFTDLSQFYRCFRQATGLSPQAYKRSKTRPRGKAK